MSSTPSGRGERKTSAPIEDRLDLLDFLALLSRMRWSWLGASLVVAIGALAIALSLPLYYKSTATFLPPLGSSSSGYLSLLSGGALPTGFEGNQVSGRELVPLLNSRSMRVAMIEELDLQERYSESTLRGTLQALSKHLEIGLETEGGFAATTIVAISISTWDEDPAFAAEMANWMVEELEARVTSMNTEQASMQAEFLETEIESARSKLEQDQQEFAEFSQQTHVFSLDQQLVAVAGAIADAQANLSALRIREAAIAPLYGADHPLRRTLRRERQAAEAEFEKVMKGGAGDLVLDLSKLPEHQQEYLSLYSRVTVGIKLLEQLVPQLELAGLRARFQAPRLRPVEAAVPADYKDRPKRATIVLAIVVLFQVLWVLWLLVTERMRVLRIANPARHREIMRVLRPRAYPHGD